MSHHKKNSDHNHRRQPSLVWPLILISVGVVFLLANFGYLPPGTIDNLWQFWPLILIFIGVDILLGRRSVVGNVLVALLVGGILCGTLGVLVFNSGLPSQTTFNFSPWVTPAGSPQQESLRLPLDGVEIADVSIDWDNYPAHLFALSDSNNLFEADVFYERELMFDHQTGRSRAEIELDSRNRNNTDRSRAYTWEVGLSPRAKVNLTLDAGSGTGEYDFSRLNLGELDIDAGSGPLLITLPEAGQVQGKLDGGSGAISLTIPDSVAAKIILEAGSGAFLPGDRLQADPTVDDDDVTIWLTENFPGAADYVELEIDQGSGAIRVE